MVEGNYSLRWESYKNNLSRGFSKLQQMQEFVDVTLAAGGHLVGAHQNILALASPYFKEMLKSAPCRHPVIFLGPINHTVLAFILEYIYTGEVKMPSCILPSFVEASKMLHIIGISDIKVPEKPLPLIHEQVIDNENQVNVQPFLTEETNTPQIFVNLNRELTVESSIQNSENVENRSADTIAQFTISQENLVQPLEVREIQPSQYGVGAETVTIPHEISDSMSIGNVGSTKIAACIQIDNESKVNIHPLIPGGNDNGDDANNDSEDSLQQDESMTMHNEDYAMETDFENLIQSKVVQIDPGINKEHSQIVQEVNSIESNSQNNAPESDDNAYRVNVPTETGVITICQMPTLSGVNQDTKMTDYEKILGNITNALYAKSSRGSIKMILNRFIYLLHFKSYGGRKRRWRCMDYRKNKCKAYVDMFEEVVSSRKNAHNHPFHDAQIIKFGRRHQLYTSIAQLRSILKKDAKEDNETDEQSDVDKGTE